MIRPREPYGPLVEATGPEVLFGEISIDLLQARFWITSGLLTTRGVTNSGIA
jgi:hypothetical protein